LNKGKIKPIFIKRENYENKERKSERERERERGN
jgi:hypothetical protein